MIFGLFLSIFHLFQLIVVWFWRNLWTMDILERCNKFLCHVTFCNRLLHSVTFMKFSLYISIFCFFLASICLILMKFLGGGYFGNIYQIFCNSCEIQLISFYFLLFLSFQVVQFCFSKWKFVQTCKGAIFHLRRVPSSGPCL